MISISLYGRNACAAGIPAALFCGPLFVEYDAMRKVYNANDRRTRKPRR
jgi:hypothetical protein